MTTVVPAGKNRPAVPPSLSKCRRMVSLALFFSLLATETEAAQLRRAHKPAKQPVTEERVTAPKPMPERLPDRSRQLAANDQTYGPQQRPAQEASSAQNVPAQDATTSNPVGVAPESPQEEPLPPWMVRTFDLPGAGVLTPKGTLILEPYLQYAHLSSNRVTLTGFTIVPALTIGLINIQGVSRDIYTAALVGRYGLTNRLELEVRVPYLYREDSLSQRPLATPSTANTVSTATGSGLGDVETTGRFQINNGGPDEPYFVAFTRFKSTTGKGPFEVPTDPITGFQTELPTGSGFYILQPGFTALFPSDPAVLFGSISYIWNMSRNIGGQIGRIDPGSGVNANVGLGISLNEKLSLTLGYDHTVFERPTSASNLLLTTTPQVTQIGVLLIGGAYRLSDRSFVNFVVGVGATREAPDLQVTIRIPTAVFTQK
ncbi:MAG: hypothetical protein OJF47_001806 [Nitrospira sp.]|nr:MAG: hypothetical protein OJF47_001806 [Nitrospira sp.]